MIEFTKETIDAIVEGQNQCGFTNMYGMPCNEHCKYFETCSRRKRNESKEPSK